MDKGYTCELEIKHYYRTFPSTHAHYNSYSLLVPSSSLSGGSVSFVSVGLFDDFFVRIHKVHHLPDAMKIFGALCTTSEMLRNVARLNPDQYTNIS